MRIVLSGRNLWFAAAAAVLWNAAQATAQEPPANRVAGRIVVEDTQQPVAGAKVTVIYDKSAWKDRHEIRDTVTDDKGYFEIGVPAGHGWITWPNLPPGYWMWNTFPPKYVVSPEAPIATRDFVVQRGTIWHARVVEHSTGTPCLGSIVSLYQDKGRQFISIGREADSNGEAGLTIPLQGGEFVLGCGHPGGKFQELPTAKLIVEAGFLPEQVVKADADAKSGTWTFLDSEGHAARLTGAKATLKEKKLELQFSLTRAKEVATTTISGQVLDESGEPVVAADVALALAGENGCGTISFQYPLRATTDAKGRYSMANVPQRHANLNRPMRVAVFAKKAGFVAGETPVFEVSSTNTVQEVPPVKLTLPTPIRLLVVDPEGQPLSAAWVESSRDDAASRFVLVKTGGDGRCVINQFPPGVHRLEVTHGELFGSATVVVGRTEVDATIRLARPLPAEAVDPTTKLEIDPIKPGQALPEWSIAEWTDGKPRRLADFQGKVVVLDFWGVWCGPCLRTIPAIQELQKKYHNQDVIFLGIHTAGTELSQVRELLKIKDWDAPTGLDTGTEITAGATVVRYGIRGYPTVMVIDRQGKVVFNTGADDAHGDQERANRKMQHVAKALGLPWPIDENMPREKLNSLLTKMQVHFYSEAIDTALKAR